MDIRKESIISAELQLEGTITVRADSKEFEYLNNLFITGNKATGILRDFGFDGTIIVIDMQTTIVRLLNADETNENFVTGDKGTSVRCGEFIIKATSRQIIGPKGGF